MSSLRIASGYCSEIGRRDENQDFVATCVPTGSALDLRGIIAVVADGVGGSKGGRVAAEMAVSQFVDGYYQLPETLGVTRAADRALSAANSWVHAQGRVDPNLQGMATTFSALILRGSEAHVVHVGDTRIYELHDGALQQLTSDHCLAHPDMRHVLHRGVGFDRGIRIDFARRPLNLHDRYLVCSDGVHGTLKDARILSILAERGAPEETARRLVHEAIDSGSRDNATALVIDVLDLPPPSVTDVQVAIADRPIVELPRSGDCVDGFTLREVISDGRYSRLYLATDDASGRDTVLKFPKPHITTDATYRSAFAREAWITATVRSPFVGEVMQLADSRQTCLYAAMPHYKGATLEQRLRGGSPMSLRSGVEIGVQLAKAVYALHRIQIIHRDIKPDNVMLVDDDNVKLLDLGVARLAGFPEFMPEDIPGTPSYMAPELFAGQQGDQQSDVYALGVTLYRVFSGGSYPYGEIEPGMRPRFGKYTPLTAHRRDLPAWLDSVLGRATALAANDRFEDTMELAFELENGLARGGQKVRRFSPGSERDPVRIWQGLCLLLLVALCVAVFGRTR